MALYTEQPVAGSTLSEQQNIAASPQTPVSVLHILWTAHFGGIERLVLDLASAQLGSAGVRVNVLFGQGKGEMLALYRQRGIPCLNADLRHGFDFRPSRMRALRQILAEFDVLHFHAYIPALGRAALNSAARIVYTEHGNFGFGRPATLQDILRRHLLGRFLKSRVDFLSFNSHFTREIAESRYNLQSVRREVVYNGIQLKKDEPSAESISSEIRSRIEGQFVVGTCSRFAGFKRIDRLIEAFATFSANRKAVLLLLGDGPLRGQLMAQAASLGIADKVIFAGYQEQVRAYQQRMDLSVLPSEREPFGLAALETLSLGTPTLVFQDAGGLAEVVQHCNTADVVSDVTALTRRMEHYYATGRGDAAARDARIDYTRKFGIDAMAGAFAVIYNRIGRDHES